MPPVPAALAKKYKFALVSGSPRRRELLRGLGLRFSVVKPKSEEKIRAKYFRQDIIKTTLDKINSVPCLPGQILIACDTLVVCGGKVLGKPANEKQAASFLRLLSGKKHTVLTCLAMKLFRRGKIFVSHKTVATQVWFREISETEISVYIRTSVPYDKAGAYGIQETGSLFVRRIAGCYYNIMGLPVSSLIDMLTALQKKEQNKR